MQLVYLNQSPLFRPEHPCFHSIFTTSAFKDSNALFTVLTGNLKSQTRRLLDKCQCELFTAGNSFSFGINAFLMVHTVIL